MALWYSQSNLNPYESVSLGYQSILLGMDSSMTEPDWEIYDTGIQIQQNSKYRIIDIIPIQNYQAEWSIYSSSCRTKFMFWCIDLFRQTANKISKLYMSSVTGIHWKLEDSPYIGPELWIPFLSYDNMDNKYQGAVSIRKTVLPGMAIPMLKIRRPNGRLIFNMEIAIRR